jgi:hypothetical protein
VNTIVLPCDLHWDVTGITKSDSPVLHDKAGFQFLDSPGRRELEVEEFQSKFAKEALIFQSTSVTKPEVNDLPFAAGGTEIEKVWPSFSKCAKKTNPPIFLASFG